MWDEMGYDLTDGCSVHLDKQMKAFKEQLRHYASKELWSTVMVIHCRYCGFHESHRVMLGHHG